MLIGVRLLPALGLNTFIYITMRLCMSDAKNHCCILFRA